jgi:hypothetical protein
VPLELEPRFPTLHGFAQRLTVQREPRSLDRRALAIGAHVAVDREERRLALDLDAEPDRPAGWTSASDLGRRERGGGVARFQDVGVSGLGDAGASSGHGSMRPASPSDQDIDK